MWCAFCLANEKNSEMGHTNDQWADFDDSIKSSFWRKCRARCKCFSPWIFIWPTSSFVQTFFQHLFWAFLYFWIESYFPPQFVCPSTFFSRLFLLFFLLDFFLAFYLLDYFFNTWLFDEIVRLRYRSLRSSRVLLIAAYSIFTLLDFLFARLFDYSTFCLLDFFTLLMSRMSRTNNKKFWKKIKLTRKYSVIILSQFSSILNVFF